MFQGVCEPYAKQKQKSCAYVHFSGKGVPQFISSTQKAQGPKEVKDQRSNSSFILLAKQMRPKWSREVTRLRLCSTESRYHEPVK